MEKAAMEINFHSVDTSAVATPGVTTPGTATPRRPGTSSMHGDPRHSFRNYRPSALSPHASRPVSMTGREILMPSSNRQNWFRSRRVKKGEIEKPWIVNKDPKRKWINIIPLIGLGVGVLLAAAYVYFGLKTIVHHNYCPVLMDNFDQPTLNTKVWTQEVEVGGFGNGQFEETTATGENAFIRNGQLVIKPTLQDASLIDSNNVLNLTQLGTCTASPPSLSACIAATNTTNGTIIPPVKSARLNTRLSANIKYGRVEVVARLPGGDWLWPAIWMLPKDSVYGAWPASGEIDIVEARGNNYTYPQGGNNVASSALHWGPDSTNDGWWQTYSKAFAKRTTWSAGFHTFGLEWSDKYLYTYIDSRLLQVEYTDFRIPFWQRGNFPVSDDNGTRLDNPWAATGRAQTPFDQDFYLVLNVAVGGTNGWFKDGHSGKPWVDASPTAKRDFWMARDQWFPTWKAHGEMVVDSVKMWQQC